MGQVRDKRYDFYKGLLIFGVIWGHVITALKGDVEISVWIARFLRTYDMPMFAFITGVFLNKSIKRHSPLSVLLDKIGMIWFPILIWNLLFNLISGSSIFNVGRFWFLWSIFYCSCVIIIIEGVFYFNRVVKITALFAVMVLFHLGVGDKWNIGFLFFPCLIGYYYEVMYNFVFCRIKKRHFSYLKVGICILFVTMQYFWSVEYNVWNTGCNIFAFGTPIVTMFRIIYRGILGVVGCIVMKILFNQIYENFNTSQLSLLNQMRLGVVTIGRYTMELYILQTLFVEIYGNTAVRLLVNTLGVNPFVYNANILGLIIAPVISIMAVWVIYYLQRGVKKIPLIGNYIFGIKLSMYLKKRI